MERLTPRGDGVVRVEIDGRSEMVYAAGPPGDRWAFWNGRVFRWTSAGAPAADAGPSPPRRRTHGARIDVTSPMPALIVAVKVAEGDEVKNGDTLVLVEAMKMELPVPAPSDGRVRAIRCRPGDLVQGDAVLIELE